MAATSAFVGMRGVTIVLSAKVLGTTGKGIEVKVTRTKEVKCRSCGYELDAHSEAFGDGSPVEGDVSVCMRCQEISVFNADLTPREPTATERRAIKAEIGEQISLVQKICKDVVWE